MNVHDIPDFFQEESDLALRRRAQWLNDRLGLDSQFLSQVLGENELKIKEWKNGLDRLAPSSESVLLELWYVVLHLLSYYNNDENRVRQLLEQSSPPTSAKVFSPLLPPWFGASLKSYLEEHGVDGVKAVNEWLMSVRFGDPYFSASKSATCP